MNAEQITVVNANIVNMDVDSVVNAANPGLQQGGGVCGAIFKAAGSRSLQDACDEIGHCRCGGAVITPGFRLKAKYIIHAVGPVWHGGKAGEPEQLYSCYQNALKLLVQNGGKSIAFPFISSGIYGYPKRKAWEQAFRSCIDFCRNCPDEDIRIFFTLLDPYDAEEAQKLYMELVESESDL